MPYLLTIVLLAAAACATEYGRVGLGVWGPAPAARSTASTPAGCQTTADCEKGYFCGPQRFCYGPTYVAPRDPIHQAVNPRLW